MNTYYELLNHLKTTFEEDERVSQVVTGDHEEWKQDVFPLVHIDITDSPFTGLNNTSTIQFNVTIQVLTVRDVNKKDIKDRFWHNDNRHDNWNDCFSILSTARNKLVKDHLGNNISILTVTPAEKLTWAYGNGLDGWEQSFLIDIPDNFTSIC